MNIRFDSKPVSGESDKYIKTKIKSYVGKINTNFWSKQIPKKSIYHTNVCN